MSYQLSAPAAGLRGRPSKFTPERIQQIKDLVARGETCERIAALIGVTVGTLKVTCSRLGISLRKPRSRTGLSPLRPATRLPGTATFSICVRYNGKEQNSELPLTPAMIRQLALEASARDQRISDLAKDLLQAVTKKGLIDEVLKE
jgi:hypothetical protein